MSDVYLFYAGLRIQGGIFYTNVSVAARESQETTTRATTDDQNARPRTIVVVDVADDVVV